MTDTSKEVVDLFSPYHDGSMQFDQDGGWVSKDDYDALAAKLASMRELVLVLLNDDNRAFSGMRTRAEVAEAKLTALDTDALVRAALERSADMIAEYATSQHVAHDIRVGIFPDQSPKREAMADDIRALADDDEAMAAIKKNAGWTT